MLLIDEVDRSDEEFEAFLLEVLSDFQITIPEIGTIRAKEKPVVILTSNRTREVHDALKRRCLYFWIDYPSFQKELEIVRAKLPEASEKLASQVTRFVQELREVELYKVPGVAETLDWTRRSRRSRQGSARRERRRGDPGRTPEISRRRRPGERRSSPGHPRAGRRGRVTA